MPKPTYAKLLKEAIDTAAPASSTDRAELKGQLVAINKELSGPMSNAERILLCEERASIRKALANLDAQ